VFLYVAYSLTRRSIRWLLGLADREALIRELLAENMVLRIRINDQWRICFRWQRGDAWDVEIVDYH